MRGEDPVENRRRGVSPAADRSGSSRSAVVLRRGCQDRWIRSRHPDRAAGGAREPRFRVPVRSATRHRRVRASRTASATWHWHRVCRSSCGARLRIRDSLNSPAAAGSPIRSSCASRPTACCATRGRKRCRRALPRSGCGCRTSISFSRMRSGSRTSISSSPMRCAARPSCSSTIWCAKTEASWTCSWRTTRSSTNGWRVTMAFRTWSATGSVA